MASTGVIGVALPIDKVVAGIRAAVGRTRTRPGSDAARAIMTTDPFPKEHAVACRPPRARSRWAARPRARE